MEEKMSKKEAMRKYKDDYIVIVGVETDTKIGTVVFTGKEEDAYNYLDKVTNGTILIGDNLQEKDLFGGIVFNE